MKYKIPVGTVIARRKRLAQETEVWEDFTTVYEVIYDEDDRATKPGWWTDYFYFFTLRTDFDFDMIAVHRDAIEILSTR